MSDHGDERPAISIRARQRRGLETASESAPSVNEGGNDEKPYKVGYKCPPKHTQFKAGPHGPRKGRRKGSKNWSTIMAEAASRRRTIGVGGKKVRMSGSEAVAEQTVINAIKGCPKARRDFINEMHRLAGSAPTSSADPAPTAEALSGNDAALLADFYRRTAKLRGEES